MDGINIWAVLAAAASAFLLGGLWYSPVAFLNTWLREAKVDVSTMEDHRPIVFGISFAWSLIAAFGFALYLGPAPSLAVSLRFALFIGVAWVASSYGINYQFASRSFKLFLIDAGYHVVQFLLYGLIIGLWH